MHIQNRLVADGALVAALLSSSACAPPPATVTVAAANVTHIDCNGDYTADVSMTAVPATQEVTVTPSTFNNNNVTVATTLAPITFTGSTVQGLSGALTNTCADGTFIFLVQSSAKLVGASQTVTIPAIGASFPTGFPDTNGTPLAFREQFDLKNCGNAAANFTVTAKPGFNVQNGIAVAPAGAVNIGGGQKKTFTVTGSKINEPPPGTQFLLTVAPPPPGTNCTHVVNVE